MPAHLAILSFLQLVAEANVEPSQHESKWWEIERDYRLARVIKVSILEQNSHRTKLRSLWYWIDITQTRNSVLTEVMLSIYSYNMLRKLVMSVY